MTTKNEHVALTPPNGRGGLFIEDGKTIAHTEDLANDERTALGLEPLPKPAQAEVPVSETPPEEVTNG